MSVVVVVPSRGRPDALRDTVAAIQSTSALVSTRIVVAVDNNDPALDGYRRAIIESSGIEYRERPLLVRLAEDETGDLVRATNTVSMRIAREDPTCIIGNLGDDHRPRTYGWDARITEALATPGIAYGDDLLQGEALPTAPFISAEIVLALGWYALPTCRHMYIDDAWAALGYRLNALHFLPDVVIEHVHPGAGKAQMDEGYLRADASTGADRVAYEEWLTGGQAARDVERVLQRLGQEAA